MVELLCVGQHLLNGMVLERQCPDEEVQYLRKWGYPDGKELGTL